MKLLERFLLIIFLLLIVSVIIFIGFKNYSSNLKQNKVCFKNDCFSVEVADTESKRTQGLMFRKKLEQDRGMLFIFDEEGIYSFWMKNTLIPLDIIWINEKDEVVFIKKYFQPCQEEPCKSVTPDKEAKYVLEINGGLADKINIKVGDKFDF